MRALFVVGIALAASWSVAHAQMYRWVDKDGGVHYTQNPPPADAKATQKMSDTNGAGPANPDLPYASQLAAKNYPVTLYTAPDCGAPCEQARSHLVKRAVPFTEKSVKEQKDVEAMKSVSGSPEFPFLIVGSLKQSGYLPGSYDSLLDTAGYPSSAPQLPVEALRKMAPATPASKTSSASSPSTPESGANSGAQPK
jgi:hypothetical protein